MRYFLFLSYHGGAYAGWQIQPNAHTVQAQIEQDLSLLLRQSVSIVGAGRTDAGVHARGMVAHFDAELSVDQGLELVRRLNSLLPRDISIQGVRAVVPDAHSRFSAISRTYCYYVCLSKEAFCPDFFFHIRRKPNFELMNDAAALLLQYNDFESFSKLHTDVKTHICHIREAYWSAMDPLPQVRSKSSFVEERYAFTITADRFLRNMVRAIVGTLFDVGSGKLSIEGFRHIIESRSRSNAGSSAPAGALFLEEVVYPEEIFLS